MSDKSSVYGALSATMALFSGTEPTAAKPNYSAGFNVAGLSEVTVTPNYIESSLPADNNATAHYRKLIKDEDLSIKVDGMSNAKRASIYGATLTNDGDVQFGDKDTPPYCGYGYVTLEDNDGSDAYVGHYFPKIKCSRNAVTHTTKGDAITFGTETISAKAMVANYGKVEVISHDFTTYAAAYAWLASLLDIGTYYKINVQVQNEDATHYTDFDGITFIPSGDSFSLAITGYSGVTAAYDNGTEIASTITGGSGTYTLSNLETDHEIVIVF